MIKETFKIIPSFPDYLISNYGRVKTKARKVRYTHAVTKEEHFRQTEEKFLKVSFNKFTGYKFYGLRKNKRGYSKTIHQLVADAFLPKEKGKDYINHKDGNKHNNVVENLERCTNVYNHEHATRTGLKASGDRIATSKLNSSSINAIRWLISEGYTHKTIAKAFLVSRAAISLISEGKTWKHIRENPPSTATCRPRKEII